MGKKYIYKNLNWIRSNLYIFIGVFILNLLFPFYGDDLVAIQVREELGIIEGIKWFYNGSNPRVQNILVLFFTYKQTILHDLISSFIFVWFIHIIQKITLQNKINIVSLLILGVIPSIWTDLFLATPSFYNHFIGFLIGLITYLSIKEDWNIYLKIALCFILGNTGLLIVAPFMFLIWFTFKTRLIIPISLGVLLFLSFDGSYVRSYSDNLHLATPIEAITKLMEAWEYWFLALGVLVLGYENKISSTFKIWHLTGFITILLISVLPIKEIGLGRWTGVALLFHCIGTLQSSNYNLKRLALIAYTFYIIGLVRFNITGYKSYDDILYNYSINIEYNLWNKTKFDKRINMYETKQHQKLDR